MTPADLRAAGEALFGERWQSDLADALGVNDRTVRRWTAGDRGISNGVEAAIRALLLARRREIDKLVA